MLEINNFSNRYSVKYLDSSDINTIYDLCSQNSIFYDYHPPFVTKESILEDMEALPPNKAKEDKYYVGLFDENNLVCILDLIDGYPDEKTIMLGLFMMNKAYQGKGIGSAIIEELLSYLKSKGYKRVRIGVDKDNPQSNHFWLKNGFMIDNDSDRFYHVMIRNL